MSISNYIDIFLIMAAVLLSAFIGGEALAIGYYVFSAIMITFSVANTYILFEYIRGK